MPKRGIQPKGLSLLRTQKDETNCTTVSVVKKEGYRSSPALNPLPYADTAHGGDPYGGRLHVIRANDYRWNRGATAQQYGFRMAAGQTYLLACQWSPSGSLQYQRETMTQL